MSVFAKAHLSNEGCSGPRGTIETTVEACVDDVLAWEVGQIGHPYDCILFSLYEDEDGVNLIDGETHQLEFDVDSQSWNEAT